MPQFVPTETECRSGCKSSVMGQAGNGLLKPGYGTFSCRRWPGGSRCGKRLLADDLSTLFDIPDPAQLPWTDRNSPLLGGSGATPATGGSLTTPPKPQSHTRRPHLRLLAVSRQRAAQHPQTPHRLGERRASWIEFRGSWTSIAGRLGPRRFRTEGPGRVALRPVRERDLALARQLFGPQFPIL